MKSNLENNFKDAFEQYELPYNESAWASLNERLDKSQGVNTQKTTSGNTWKWIAGIAIIASAAVVFSIINNVTPSDENKNAIAIIADQEKERLNENKASETIHQNEPEKKNTSNLEKDIHSDKDVINTNNNTEKSNNKENQSSSASKTPERKQDNPIQNTSNNNKSVVLNHSEDKNITNSSNKSEGERFTSRATSGMVNRSSIVLPKIESVCQNTTIPIANSNEISIIITSPNGYITTIGAKRTIEYTPTETGVHTISGVPHNLNKSEFYVKETPKVDFAINEEIKYENGIPSIPLETYSEGSNFEWSFENSSIKQFGSKANARFYKKGIYDITLTSKASNGCTSSISKTVTINEDYNLLAPSGFLPSSDNPRNSRFIPLALTIRNTDFKMIIIEPRTGAIIFETTSVEGWDGTDRTTHRLAEENKSYAWKVILANPEPGEPKEYSGIVVRL